MTPAQATLPSFLELVGMEDYPCLGARSAGRRQTLLVREYTSLSTDPTPLASDLASFTRRFATPPSEFAAMAAVSTDDIVTSEASFEDYLWQVLNRLHAQDPDRWDPAYSDDPTDPTFKFSFAGRAMFVIGLHPMASRRARRCRDIVLVFNPVWQFEGLRARHQLDGLAEAIRARDTAWQGSINPNLAFEGTASDALQYSGREVDLSWQCPFRPA